ncbi:fibronectin type III domain-containing protein [Cohnella herbarum]|uniref:S-layer homology domain-containing protein n=1 Tax=Cohnella herbarum TaxID=2728023 RepID=A0A7Z2VPG7_9BACL|nr:S-layer homology domain-containing protein [Cohnella herbarum]QJD86784.1 hypothetical protein HH215_28840 [Cohnella herbarum]
MTRFIRQRFHGMNAALAAVLLASSLSLAPSPAKAAADSDLLAYEPFGSAAGLPLHGTGTGSGWDVNKWEVQLDDTTIPGYQLSDTEPLVLGDLKRSGNYAEGGSGYKAAYRKLDLRWDGMFAEYLQDGQVGKDGTTLWISALVRKNTASNDPSFIGGGEFATANFGMGYFGADSHDDGGIKYWSVMLGTPSVSQKIVRSNVPVAVGETALLVLKAEFGATSRMSLFVNPESLAGTAPAEPSAVIESSAPAFLRYFVARSDTGATGNMSFDEIRIGKTFASVTPVLVEDLESPTAPTGLTADQIKATSLELNWIASTDNIGVARYDVYLNGASEPIGSVAGTKTNYSVIGLRSETEYVFTVIARDEYGNESAMSAPFSVTTLARPPYGGAGVLLAREPFDYLAGALHGRNGGKGWSQPWAVQSDSKTVPGYNTEESVTSAVYYSGTNGDLYRSGRYASGGDAYLTAYRSLDASQNGPFRAVLASDGQIGKTGTTFWLSTLMRLQPDNPSEAWVGLSGTEWYKQSLSVGYFGGPVRNWTLRIGTNDYVSDVPIVAGETALLALKLEYGSTNVVSLYVNPAELRGQEPEEADATALTTSGLTFSKVVYYGGYAAGRSAIDELRIGTGFGIVTPTFLDTEAPEAPAELILVRKSADTIAIGWMTPADNVGVAGYKVYADGIEAGVTDQPSYKLTGLAWGREYVLTVKAFDSEGNLSAASESLVVATDTEPADNNLYNFEDGELHGLALLDNKQPGTIVSTTERAFKGESSAKVTLPGGNAETVGIDNPDARIANGKTIKYRFYIPSGQEDFALQPFVFGAGWSFNGDFKETKFLPKDEWFELTVAMANGDSPSPRLGVIIHNPNAAVFYVDSITYSGFGEPDTTPPTVPGNVRDNYKTDNIVNMSWNASTDNEKLANYRVYVDGVMAGSTSATSYTVKGLAAGTLYNLTVSAVDNSGNESAPSVALIVTTDPAHAKLVGTPFGNDSDEAGYAFDGLLNTEYVSAANNAYVGLEVGAGEAKRLTKIKYVPIANDPESMIGGKFQGSMDNETYMTLYTIRSADSGWSEIPVNAPQAFRYFRYVASPNEPARVAEIELYGVDGDSEQPSAPAGLRAESVTDTSVMLRWEASLDNVGVTGYEARMGTEVVARTSDTNAVVSGLRANRAYSFTVVAKDGAGNVSESSEALVATTTASTITVQAINYRELGLLTITGQLSAGRNRQVTVEAKDSTGRLHYLDQVTTGFDGSFIASVANTEVGSVDRFTVTAGGDGIAGLAVTDVRIANNPNPNPNPGTTSGPGQVSTGTASMMEVSSLQASGDKAVVSIPADKNGLLLSGVAVSQLLEKTLELSKGSLILRFPKDTLRSLLGMVPVDDLKSATVTVQVEQLSDVEANRMASESGNPALYRLAGSVYRLELSIATADGQVRKLKQFDVPVALSLSIPAGSDADLLGLYYRNPQTKEWEYVGGTIDPASDRLVADLPHFSEFGLLEYRKKFVDVGDEWFARPIMAVAAKHVVKGVSDSRFSPKGQVTRAEFAAMLVRMFRLPTASNAAPFADLEANAWYAGEVATAYEAKLVEGLNDRTFGPNLPITREQMAVMIRRAYELKSGRTLPATGEKYEDMGFLSVWATDSVSALRAAGLMNGNGNNKFNPQGYATRAEAAQTLYALLKI